MDYKQRETIRNAYYNAWKQAEKNSTEATDALSAAIDEKISTRRAAIRADKAWALDPETQKRIDEYTERSAEAERNENHARMAYYISADNARRALIEELTVAACEILNKYAGKAYGEKTSKKICAEIEARTNYRAYIKQEYSRSTISFYPETWVGYREDLKASYYSVTDAAPAPILIDNKIQPTKPENWSPDFCNPYQDDGTPAEIAAAVIQAYKAAEDAYKAYQAAQSAYNQITPTKARRIDCNGPRGLF